MHSSALWQEDIERLSSHDNYCHSIPLPKKENLKSCLICISASQKLSCCMAKTLMCNLACNIFQHNIQYHFLNFTQPYQFSQLVAVIVSELHVQPHTHFHVPEKKGWRKKRAWYPVYVSKLSSSRQIDKYISPRYTASIADRCFIFQTHETTPICLGRKQEQQKKQPSYYTHPVYDVTWYKYTFVMHY